jgi:divalent metal cation (Fe/Co/Zn/Cd) transporter
VFGLLHASNLLGGANILYTILQIIYALLFGLVAASIVTLHQSLTPVIIWHFLHDFLAFSMGDRIHGVDVELSSLMIGVSLVQLLVMLLCTIYLFRQIKQTNVIVQNADET